MTQEELVNKWKEKAQVLKTMSKEEQQKWITQNKYEIANDCLTYAIETEVLNPMANLIDIKQPTS